MLALVLALGGLPSKAEMPGPAGKDGKIIAGKARFTVITPQLIRMEWSEDGVFEDRASLTFINRDLPVPEFKVSKSPRKLVVRTSALTLEYKIADGAFSKENLKVEFRTAGKKTVWYPGADDSGNLMGTARTLDRADGRVLGRDPLEKGLLSRDGWALVDDSKAYLFDAEGWVAARPEGERQDWYLFAYGHEYRKALADYSRVAGAAPLPPRYVFGYWWSRYWQYSDSELRDIIARLRSVDIPVDVLIIDMDWHETWGLSNGSKKDEDGHSLIGWTGYTWQKELFPNPSNMFEWAHRAGLHTALNLHPASGINPREEPYERFCEEYGWTEKGKFVPFHIDEKKWADAYYKAVLKPIEDQGNDFWWLDWQQWKESLYNPGLSNTFWLNHVFFKYAEENHPDARPFLYHRWGGLGSHRYPLGFSGDTFCTWASLEYQPEFTATSANVNYGYWGHDLGGHYFRDNNAEETNPEQYTRWLQYGVFSPLYKIHPSKHPNLKRYPWLFPEHLFRMVDAFHLRYALVPYIYNAARRNYDTGIAMCHPLYYDYPEAAEAYDNPREFLFGDDILATCVAVPADKTTGLATIKMWFPEGNDWFDMASGGMHPGGSKLDLAYTLDENPWFVKAGSLLPMNPAHVRSLASPSDTLVLTAIPGADGSLLYYEDDGVSRNYDTQFATTMVSQKRSANSVSLTIQPRKGSYEGMKATRSYELRFPATRTPQAVKVNGREIPYARFPETGQWTYDAYTLAPVVYLKDVSVAEPLEVELILPEGHADAALYGLQGLFARCRNLSEPYKNEQGLKDRKKMLPTEYLKVSQCPNFIMEDPRGIFGYIEALKTNLDAYAGSLEAETLISESFKARLKAQIIDGTSSGSFRSAF